MILPENVYYRVKPDTSQLESEEKNLSKLKADRDTIKSALESKEKLDGICSKILLQSAKSRSPLGLLFLLSLLFNHLDRDIDQIGKSYCLRFLFLL